MPDTESPSSSPLLLSIQEATLVRGGNMVLNDLCLEIAEGEHTALLGPNGSGKSSLIKLLTREHYPLARPGGASSVRLFGQERWNATELRSLLGIVTADLHHAFTAGAGGSGVTGEEAVLSGAFASLGLARHHAVTDTLRLVAQEALEWMEASHLRHKPMSAMSTGEARRILIARALISDPRALLLDEPTTGLDLVSTHRFLETIRTLARRHGKTVLLVTHHIHEIIPEIGRVVLLRSGSVFRDGAKEEILTDEVLSALYDSPVRVRSGADGFYHAEAAPVRHRSNEAIKV